MEQIVNSSVFNADRQPTAWRICALWASQLSGYPRVFLHLLPTIHAYPPMYARNLRTYIFTYVDRFVPDEKALPVPEKAGSAHDSVSTTMVPLG